MKRITLIAAMVLLAALPAAAQKQKTPAFDRGFDKSNALFVPKGMMTVGSSISFHHYSIGQNDVQGYDIASLLTGIQGGLSTVRVSPAFLYFVKDNLAFGARLGYSYTSMDLDRAAFELDSDTSFDLSNHYYSGQSYSCSAVMRNYIPLFGSRIFAMFSEMRLGGGISQKKTYRMEEGEKDGTYSDGYKVNVGVYPGVAAFLTNNLAFEVSVGVLSISYAHDTQTENQVATSGYSHFGTSYKPDLLELSFSMMYYFPVKR